MKLRLSNLHTKVIDSTAEERAWLSNYLSFEDASARYRYDKDAKIRLFNRFACTFPSGVYALVRRGALKKGFKLELEDARTRPIAVDTSANISWLRDYQHAAIEAAVDETRGIIWAPTGSGKTEIAVGLTKVLPCSWLFLVHRKTLVNQTAERYHRRTGDHAYVFRNNDDDESFSAWDTQMQNSTGGRLIVATFQTFVAALKSGSTWADAVLSNTRGLIVDESHVLPADTFYRVAQSTPKAYWRFGLSGTPLARGDRRSVKAVAALGPVIYRIRSETLVKAGVLAEPKIVMPKVEQFSNKPTHQGVYGDLVVRSSKRNKQVVACVEKSAKPCLVFVKQINHGQELKKRLLKAGIAVDFVSGKEPDHKREAMKQDLERGERDVLIASVVFQEGVDIPNLASVVMAHGGRSVIATLQRIGRGMRTDDGKKKTFEVWDIFDCGSMLESQSHARARAYKRESFDVEIVE